MSDDKKHKEFFLGQISKCADYFDKWLYPEKSSVLEFDGEPLDKSLYCKLYDTFLDYNQKKRNDHSLIVHNCIGCNFEEGARAIHYFLLTNRECTNVQYYLNLYSFLFYAQAERIGVIYKELGYCTNKGDFDWAQFQNLQKIKYWANFFKHPKAYMFLHHPDFFLETDPRKPNFLISHVIDSEFVKNFYRPGADNQQLRYFLENKKSVKVFFPDLIDFTKTLCDEFEKIISTISTKSSFIEKLNEYTTVDSRLTP